MWRNADLQYRQKVLSHKIAKVAVKLDDVHQELSTAIVVYLTLSLLQVPFFWLQYGIFSFTHPIVAG
jgi:hypothetical protein